MPPNTPSFWYRQTPNWASKALSPFSGLYYLGHMIHQSLGKPEKLNIPTICIGNLTAGGSGKTPSCLMIHDILKNTQLFDNIAFITRGYGRETTTPIKALKSHSFRDIGDEAMLLKSIAQTYVSGDRRMAIELALKDNIDCLIFDDGFQNTQINYTLRGLAINSFDGFGNGQLLPGGPLREPIKKGLKRADFIIFIDDVRGNNLNNTLFEQTKAPIFKARLKLDLSHIDLNKPYIAFTGLATPDKFFASLEHAGVHLVHQQSFPDHYNFTDDDMIKLKKQADENEASLLTTSKDFVRLQPNDQSFVTQIFSQLEIDERDHLQSFLNNHLS